VPKQEKNMKRKIIKQANQAYTITLPIEWVRKNNISEKSEVDLSIEGRSIIINSQNNVSGGKVKIDFSGMDITTVYRYLGALYAKGIDEVEITSKEDISSKIISALNYFIGYALVSQEGNKYIVKDLGGEKQSDLDEIFKRVFQIILLFFESAVNDIFGKQEETIESLKSRDKEVNKFCLFLQRAINKMSYPDPINGRALFTYSYALEKIGDEIERMWRTNIKYDIKKSPALKKLVENSYEGLAKAFDFHFQFNSSRIGAIYSTREKVRNESLKLKGLNGNTFRFVRQAVKIVEDAADLSHLTLIMKL